MTSTSFNSPQSCCRELFDHSRETCPPSLVGETASQDPCAPSNEHAVKARQMRAFAGQRKFQAPVADDFSRGMLAEGQSLGDNALKHNGLINNLAAWWRRQTAD